MFPFCGYTGTCHSPQSHIFYEHVNISKQSYVQTGMEEMFVQPEGQGYIS